MITFLEEHNGCAFFSCAMVFVDSWRFHPHPTLYSLLQECAKRFCYALLKYKYCSNQQKTIFSCPVQADRCLTTKPTYYLCSGNNKIILTHVTDQEICYWIWFANKLNYCLNRCPCSAILCFSVVILVSYLFVMVCGQNKQTIVTASLEMYTTLSCLRLGSYIRSKREGDWVRHKAKQVEPFPITEFSCPSLPGLCTPWKDTPEGVTII